MSFIPVRLLTCWIFRIGHFQRGRPHLGVKWLRLGRFWAFFAMEGRLTSTQHVVDRTGPDKVEIDQFSTSSIYNWLKTGQNSTSFQRVLLTTAKLLSIWTVMHANTSHLMSSLLCYGRGCRPVLDQLLIELVEVRSNSTIFWPVVNRTCQKLVDTTRSHQV